MPLLRRPPLPLGYQRVPAAGIEPALIRGLSPGLYRLGYAGNWCATVDEDGHYSFALAL
jgi:hypothetical protein